MHTAGRQIQYKFLCFYTFFYIFFLYAKTLAVCDYVLHSQTLRCERYHRMKNRRFPALLSPSIFHPHFSLRFLFFYDRASFHSRVFQLSGENQIFHQSKQAKPSFVTFSEFFSCLILVLGEKSQRKGEKTTRIKTKKEAADICICLQKQPSLSLSILA